MRFSLVRCLVASLFLSNASHCFAGQLKEGTIIQDGSALERAIIVNESDVNKFGHWIHEYLEKHFPDRTFPKGHGFITDEDHRLAWIVHHFSIDGHQKEIWFDITKAYREFAKVPPDAK